MRRKADVLGLIVLLGIAGYFGYTYRAQVQVALRQLEAKVRPCQSPVTYSIGSVDSRFGISEKILVARLKEAEAIWEKPSSKDLFEYKVAGGDVVVNLVYDNRQAATDKLRAAGIQIDDSKATYGALKARYDTLSAHLETAQAQHEQDVLAYKRHEATYNSKVESWNKRGGAPKQAYEQLQQEKAQLEQELRDVRAEEARLSADIDILNALATTLNQLIVQLNLNVRQYNQVGASQGEFEEGLYMSAAGVRKIDIYEYSSRNVLVRVLAHEMGHALGLEHVADTEAIMYKINHGERLTLAPDDTAELDRICSAAFF